MKKVAIAAIIMLSLVVLSTGTVSAKSDKVQRIDIPKEWQGKDQIITQKGDLVQVVWIKRVNDNKNPTSQAGHNKPATSHAYTLANYRWNLASSNNLGGVRYVINPTASGLQPATVQQAVTTSLSSWNSATMSQQRNPVKVYADTPTIDPSAQVEPTTAGSPDGLNVITWASLSDNNVIAMSTMWYNRYTHELVDADMVFNTYFAWGIAGTEGAPLIPASATFDIQDICTHEAGHWTSLGDMYSTQYSLLTMYGYASPHETLKDSLAPGDIAGAQAAY
ncbi:MAG: hypothetical protein ACXVIG_02580 [Halobacteriota archaeon]